jgi:hypothetical protein
MAGVLYCFLTDCDILVKISLARSRPGWDSQKVAQGDTQEAPIIRLGEQPTKASRGLLHSLLGLVVLLLLHVR